MGFVANDLDRLTLFLEGVYTNSRSFGERETYGKTTPEAGLASHLKRTVPPTRPPNADLRRRGYLTEAEVERLMEAAKGNRWGHRGPRRLPARPAGFRAGRPPLGSGGLRNGHPARPQGQERHVSYPIQGLLAQVSVTRDGSRRIGVHIRLVIMSLSC
jgi:hypothetical protein